MNRKERLENELKLIEQQETEVLEEIKRRELLRNATQEIKQKIEIPEFKQSIKSENKKYVEIPMPSFNFDWQFIINILVIVFMGITIYLLILTNNSLYNIETKEYPQQNLTLFFEDVKTEIYKTNEQIFNINSNMYKQFNQTNHLIYDRK